MTQIVTRRHKEKALTRRERALFQALLAGKSLTEAARAAGYSPKWPGQAGSQALKNIRRKLPDLFERHGLDDEAFIEKHILPALNAKETKFFSFEGEVTDKREVIAWGVRIEAIKLVARLKGMLREDSDGDNAAVKVVIIKAENRPPRNMTPAARDQESPMPLLTGATTPVK